MRYGSDPDRSTSKQNFRIRDKHDYLQGLDPAESKKIIDENRLDYECKYDIYIALALLKYQDRECVVAP